MPDGTPVGEKACERCREGIDRQIEAVGDKIDDLKETTTTRLNGHAGDIKELTRLTIELAEMQKTQTKSHADIAETLKLLKDEVTDLKVKAAAAEQAAAAAQQAAVAAGLPLKSKGGSQAADVLMEIIKAPWFNFFVRGCVIAALLVSGTALGKSLGLDLTKLLK